MAVENNEIFLGSGASLTFVPEVDFYIEPDDDASTVTSVQLDTTNQVHFQLIDNMYVGCTLEFYDNGVYTSSHTVTSNDNDELTFTPSIPTVDASHDYFILKGYGAPCPAPNHSTVLRLNADNWLGLVESATFPNIEIEMKQLNRILI